MNVKPYWKIPTAKWAACMAQVVEPAQQAQVLSWSPKKKKKTKFCRLLPDNSFRMNAAPPGSEGVSGEREGVGDKVGGGGKGGKMTQTLYAHMNKRKKK
jgi:hypothetical protein